MAVTIETLPQPDGWILASFDMSAAGTETLLADPGDGATFDIKDLVITVGTTGTVTFVSGSINLCGVMPLVAGTPLELFKDTPTRLVESEAFQVITATGAGKGSFRYKAVGA